MVLCIWGSRGFLKNLKNCNSDESIVMRVSTHLENKAVVGQWQIT